MTPPASGATKSARRSAPARSKVGQRSAASRPPRRVSGRAPGVVAAATAVALPAPARALPKRRPLTPVPSRKPHKQVRGRGVEAPGLALRVSDRFQSISSSALLDRLIRGRLWIGLLAFALIGIVAMQLLVLELNTGVGRSLRREALLQRENAQIGIQDSMASAGERVEPLAAATGMTIAAPGSLHFVQASTADFSRAAAALAAAKASAASAAASSATSSESSGEPAAEASTEPAAGTTAEATAEATTADSTATTPTESESSGSSSGEATSQEQSVAQTGSQE
jgi:hypothetical protein